MSTHSDQHEGHLGALYYLYYFFPSAFSWVHFALIFLVLVVGTLIVDLRYFLSYKHFLLQIPLSAQHKLHPTSGGDVFSVFNIILCIFKISFETSLLTHRLLTHM